MKIQSAIFKLIHRGAKHLGMSLCPSLWKRLALWRSARADKRFWDYRIQLVQSCPDNARLRRVNDAGQVINGCLVMHNGISVVVNSYYGEALTHLLKSNRGCHEPQEEIVFDAILKAMPSEACMLELGAYWGFYSLWFSREVHGGRVFLIEPEPENLEMGRRNFEINGQQGDFTQAYVGEIAGTAEDGRRIISVDSFTETKGLGHLNILHADIQGFELDMLRGASHLLRARQVDYLFVSTHSMDLHQACVGTLTDHGYAILVSVSPEESYSVDGVLVACSPLVNPPTFSHPAKRPGVTP